MTTIPSKILVTGVAGSIGEAVARVLHAAEYEVIGLDKSKIPDRLLSFLTATQVGDICDEQLVADVVAQADGVIHLAGWVHFEPRGAADEAKVFAINHDATRNIARLCAKQKKSLIFASTVAVHGDEASGRLDEDSPVAPSTIYGQSKLMAEAHVLEAGGTVLRLPMVYGARDRGNMARMIRAIQKGWFIVPGKGNAIRTFVGRWNVAQAIHQALSTEKARGRTYLVTDDEDITLGALCDTISELCGCWRPPRIPSTLVAGAAVVGSTLKRLLGRRMPLDWQAYRKLTQDLAFEGSRIRKELGYRPIKTLREGIKEEVDWLLGKSL